MSLRLFLLNRGGASMKARASILASCVVAMIAISAGSAHATVEPFCPASGTTISLGPNQGCTNSVRTKLISVWYYHTSGPTVHHCAVSKATDDPGGASSNVIPAVCDWGDAGGAVRTASANPGLWSYARGKNNENVQHWDFMGLKWS